jgi:hypothetical protein
MDQVHVEATDHCPRKPDMEAEARPTREIDDGS